MQSDLYKPASLVKNSSVVIHLAMILYNYSIEFCLEMVTEAHKVGATSHWGREWLLSLTTSFIFGHTFCGIILINLTSSLTSCWLLI